MGHLLGTQENVYIEHLRSGTARYYKLPAMLMNFEAGLSTKTYDEMTDEGKMTKTFSHRVCFQNYFINCRIF